MIKKSKMFRVILIGIALVGVLVSASCAPPTPTESPPTESPRMPPAVLVIPNVVEAESGVKVDIVGANFEPGEKVRIVIMYSPGVEIVPGAEGKGLTLEVDELGSFWMKGEKITPAPVSPGVYPVRVYDEKGKMVASTLLVVVEPEE